MTNLSIKTWQCYFDDLGIPEEISSEYMVYVKKLAQSNVPVIFESEHLALLLGIKRSTLLSIVNASGSFYRSYNIQKRRGGVRKISAPFPTLLMCQRWIYVNILQNIPVNDAAHGFVPGRSIITNARPHLGKKCLLKMDLDNFFPSISMNWVVNFFSQLGYSHNVAFFLAAICCENGSLPQGGATSPYLTNILLKSFDHRITALSIKYGIKYTRYADDLAFSSNYIPHKFIRIVDNVVEEYGLKVNDKKTSLKIGDGQKIVTGVSVAGSTLSLPRKTKREIRQEVYYIKKYGLSSHISKLKIRRPYYIESLLGKLIFWHQIEPDNIEVTSNIEFIRNISYSI